MYKLLMIALAASTTLAGAAQAQSYGPRPAYAVGGGYDDECRSGRFTLAGARAGVTVLGIDLGASAGLHVGLHDHCGGRRPAAYAPPPQEAYPPQAYAPPAYAQPAYAQPAYAQPSYPQPAPGQFGGYGYAYAMPMGYGYGAPCGC